MKGYISCTIHFEVDVKDEEELQTISEKIWQRNELPEKIEMVGSANVHICELVEEN